MASDDRLIPLTVIGGFLGAGKTTYLNALIKAGLPNNSLVVVNDFGDINIDAELIDYRNDRIMQLSNGCVCCTLGGTLAEQLAAALRLHLAPEAIIIEASGVANPARIADIARLSRRLCLTRVVCVIDGSQALKQAADSLIGDAWHAQVKAADTLHVNRLIASHKADVLELLQRINPAAIVKIDTACDTQQHSMTQQDNAIYRSAQPYGMSSKTSASHDSWRSFSLTEKTGVDKKKFVALLEAFGDVIFRAKGFIFLDDEANAQLLQFSGGRINLQPTLRAQDSSRLVFIGIAGERFDAFQQAIEGLFKHTYCDRSANR